MRRKHFKGSIVVILILVVSAIAGLVAQLISDSVNKGKYIIKYSEYVTKYSNEYAVPESVVYGIIKVESDFVSDAKSSAGALGLMQMIPKTFDSLQTIRKVEKLPEGMLFDPETNIDYGTYFLACLFGKYKNWKTVYAAYNAGETVVDSWLKDSKYSSDGKTLKKIPYSETSNYVKQVSKAVQKYKDLYY